MTGFFDAGQGIKSMMRLLAFLGFFLGGGIAIAGIVGWGCGLDNAVVIIGAGLGLAGGGEVLKVLQRKVEK